MNYYERDEWPAFLAAIRAAPDDDLPRLVTADWLDDFETEEARQRAEWIRGGCAYSHNEFSWLVNSSCNRPGELLGLHGWACASSDERGSYLVHGQTRYWIDRGFVTRVSAPLGVLNGGGCHRCAGAGHHPDERNWDDSPGGSGRWLGGYDEHLTCSLCFGTGRTTGVLGPLLSREPLTAAGIEVLQVSPVGVVPNEYMRSGTGPERNWAWGFSESTPHGEYMIPRDVWDLMPPTTLTDPRGRYKVFPTADAARLALGEALFRLHGPKSEVTT